MAGNELGTCLEDCTLICNTFERSAHSDMREEAVFATIARELETTRTFSNSIQKIIASYLQTPTSSSMTQQEAITQFESLSTGISNVGTKEFDGGQLTDLSIGDTEISIPDSSFGKDLQDWARDCIPCGDRLLSLVEVFPSTDFIAALRVDILARIEIINDIIGMLGNFNIYGDYCELMGLLSFMCIPDLQRLIAILTSLIAFDIPKLDGAIDLIKGLIAPIFMPIIMSITTLLDQFSLVVLSPVDCIIEHINLQLKKLNAELDSNSPLHELSSGIAMLNRGIIEGKEAIQEKLAFYINNAKALLSETAGGGSAYLKIGIRKLQFVRLISFIAAIITAINKGQLACSKEGRSPSISEIDNFFSNFLNPNIPYNVSVNVDGDILIDSVVPNSIRGVDIDGEDAVSAPEFGSIDEKVEDLKSRVVEYVQISIPCTMKTKPGESDKINKWIQELNKAAV